MRIIKFLVLSVFSVVYAPTSLAEHVPTVLTSSLAWDNEPSFEQERDLFCTNPFQFVCKDSAKFKNESDHKRQDMGQKAALSTVKKLGPDLTQRAAQAFIQSVSKGMQDAKTNDQIDVQLDLDLKDVKSFMLALKTYFSELEKLSPVKGKEADAIIEKYKKLHIERINSEPTISKENKAAMVERITKAQILTFERIISFWEEKGVDWQRDIQMTSDMISDLGGSCGPDFLRDNASMRGVTLTVEAIGADNKPFTRDEEIELLRFCPGAMLASFENSVAHEISHLYDISFAQPESYGVMAQCLSTEFGVNPGVTWMKEKDEARRKKAFWANFDEYFADYGAAEVKARALEIEKQSGTIAGLARIRKDLLSYCSEPPGKKHGSGQFRINHIYGANPTLRKIAGCDMTKPQPVTCTFKGRYPAK
jgi:hypothetical protein